jgi:hypothetical protein
LPYFGIDVDDVVIESEDQMGDDVNVAAAGIRSVFIEEETTCLTSN